MKPDLTKPDLADMAKAGIPMPEVFEDAIVVSRPRARVATDWRASLIREGKKMKLVTEGAAGVANVSTILRYHPEWSGVVAMDDFSSRVVATSPPPWDKTEAPSSVVAGPWTDGDTDRLGTWIARNVEGATKSYDVEVVASFAPGTLDRAVRVAAEANRLHPVREYLRGLAWDGTPRVNRLLASYFGADDSDYASAVGRCFLVGAVARVMTPGAKVDTMPILEGRQGVGKSTALAILAGEWFSDSKIIIGTKDGYQALRGIWILELGELEALNRAEIEGVKAFISSQVDRYRPSFGRNEVEMPRQCVFAGTTNAEEYLADATGARRFHPVRTGELDLDALRRDRDQLWAEAVAMFDAGETWWMSRDVSEAAAEEADARYVRDPWEATVERLLRSPVHQANGVTNEDCLAACGLDVALRNKGHSIRMGNILKRMGWHRTRLRRPDGSLHWVYITRNASG